MLAEFASHVDRQTGERTEGRAAIRADLDEVFKNPVRTRFAGTTERIRFVTPDVASIEATTKSSVPDEDPDVSPEPLVTMAMVGFSWTAVVVHGR